MLEIIIAFFLIYTLFASLVSGINELIVQMLAMRGRILFEGIVTMLGEMPDANETGLKNWLKKAKHKLGFGKLQDAPLTNMLYKHPLIDTLSPPGSTRPSYISPETFSSALVQVLSIDGSMGGLRQRLADRSTRLGQLLGPMLDEAQYDMNRFKIKIENHFNAVMDRASGWYKRRIQVVMFFIGLMLAVLLNADSIYIVQQLQKNPAQVDSLVLVAKELSLKADGIENNTEQVETVNDDVDQNTDPDKVQKAIDADFLLKVEAINNKIDEFKRLGLPIGWDISVKTESLFLPDQDVRFFFLGWLLTALAGTLGAPFWFDAMSKLFTVRGTGKKPD